jgi:hypothetical protein
MALSAAGLGIKNDSDGEGQQQFIRRRRRLCTNCFLCQPDSGRVKDMVV